MRFENDGGITLPSTVTGGDQGLSTINVGGGYYKNGVAVNPVLSLPPYEQIGNTLYIPEDGMYQATLPSLGSYTLMRRERPPLVRLEQMEISLLPRVGTYKGG